MMSEKQGRHYEELYNRLLERGKLMHINNKKRIRIGLVLLALLPAILIIIRRLTDSDRVVFLIIWVLCMFAVSVYLIGIEYIDDSLQKTLEDVTQRDADFGELLPDSEKLHDRIHERIRERAAELIRDGYYSEPYDMVVERVESDHESEGAEQ